MEGGRARVYGWEGLSLSWKAVAGLEGATGAALRWRVMREPLMILDRTRRPVYRSSGDAFFCFLCSPADPQ